MIQQVMAATALCGALLSASSPTRPAAVDPGVRVGPWSMNCEPNAEYCRVGQFVADATDPKKMWIKLGIFREGADLRMIILTPPLALPRVHLTLDREVEVYLDTTGCTAERCEFHSLLEKSEREILIAGQTLEIEFALKPDETTTLSLDVRQLDRALAKLPIEL